MLPDDAIAISALERQRRWPFDGSAGISSVKALISDRYGLKRRSEAFRIFS